MDQTSVQSITAVKVTVKGRVQGVGFRPFIFQIAEEFQINGTVQNNMDGVKIFAEATESRLNAFMDAIKERAPRLARVDEVKKEATAVRYVDEFTIIPSERTGKSSLVIPVDSAVCDDCLEEMNDPGNFRYRYPFINCTQCGPRYTIIDALPYDRPYTVMKEFEMCEKCQAEYEDPMNRRHHAQPIACPECGPQVTLKKMDGEIVAEREEAFPSFRALLAAGNIIAIKGLGGYHLACDAYNEEAVNRLRKRKNRPNRPLAVMAGSLEEAKQICEITDKEETVLTSPEAPIVVMKKRPENGLAQGLAQGLAPGMNTLGVMLPYTPFHHLLFDDGSVRTMVMTSANPSGLPILYKDEEAFDYLNGIADFIFTNDRAILHPLDDSVVQVVDGEISFFRRSRGYVPDPMTTDKTVHEVVALGGQQKNTFAIGRHEQIFLGPHIGEMENLEVVDHFEAEYAHLMKWMGIEQKAIAVDMHPGYMTTAMVEKFEGRVIPVQHHHAHLVSCMEDNGLSEPTFGIILDGTGYGADGNIWGFEILYGDALHYERLSHLCYTHLPGGEKAIKEPWRNAAAMMIDHFGDEGIRLAKQFFTEKNKEIDILAKMVEKDINSPLAGTCGRLFDAVSAVLGICQTSTYEGEAAIRLSEKMTEEGLDGTAYPIHYIDNPGGTTGIDFSEAFLHIIHDYLDGKPIEKIIQRFHQSIVNASVDSVVAYSNQHKGWNRSVVLSGGSFHNPFLLKEIKRRLTVLKFDVFTHKRVPCNDGGLALGQLISAAAAISSK